MRLERSLLAVSFIVSSVALLSSAAAAEPAPLVIGPSVLLEDSVPYAGHGTAGDEVVLFNVEIAPPDLNPTGTEVVVYERRTKHRLGALAPVGNPFWFIPMSIFQGAYASEGSSTSGSVIVLEVAMIANDAPPLFLRVIKYGYSYSPASGFSQEVLDVGYLPVLSSGPGELPNGLVLPETMTIAKKSDGSEFLVLADCMVGSVWATPIEDLNQWRMVLIAQELGATPATRTCEYNGQTIPGGFCGYARGPDFSVEYYVQKMWEPIPGLVLMPGAFGLTFVGKTGKVVLNNGGLGTMHQITADLLLDSALPPVAPFKPLELLVSPIPGVTDYMGSIVWDRYHPNSQWIYFQRILSNESEGNFPIYRANVTTGEVEFVAESVMLFDHPSMTSVLPPAQGRPFTVFVTSNTQERNMSFTNLLVETSHLVAPAFVVETKVFVPHDER